MTEIMNGRDLSAKVIMNLKKSVEGLKKVGVTPTLAVILVGDDEASKVYVRNKHRAAEKIGIKTIDETLPADSKQEDVLKMIEKYNNDPDVHGILVQMPLPKHIDEKAIIDAIDPKKDVDGSHPENMGRLFMNEPRALPCTPRGIMELLKEYDIDVRGQEVVIVGRSNIVGRPTLQLLLQRDATVTICHSKTQNLKEFTKTADILVVAVGKPKLITKDMVKDGAVVIDVGISRDENGKLSGDVDFENVKDVCSFITPVPGGVASGPMTATFMLQFFIGVCSARGLPPCAAPTMPALSSWSIRRPALLYPMENRRCIILVLPCWLIITDRAASSKKGSRLPMSPGPLPPATIRASISGLEL